MRIVLFLIASLAYAQTAQSLVPGNGAVGQEWGNTAFVPPAAGTPYVYQIQIDLVPSVVMSYDSGIYFSDSGSGIQIQMSTCTTSPCQQINMLHETGGAPFPIPVPFSGTDNNYMNLQIFHDSVAGGGANVDTVETYDRCGNMVATTPMTYTTSTGCVVASGGPGSPSTATYSTNTSNSTGTIAVYGDSSYHIGFIRMCVGEAAVVALKGHVPLTSGTCPVGSTLYYQWNFDGTLADASTHNSCGGPCTLTLQSGTGSATYSPTNYLGPVAIIKSLPSLTWTNTVSMRAGTSNQLDSTSSFTQALAGSSITPFWQSTCGPNIPVFDSHTATQPMLSGLVFGDYCIQLTATDVSGLSAVSTVDIGAYGSDSNGVIVQANSTATTLLGDMIGFGKNGWQANDFMAKYTIDAQYSFLGCCTPPTWATPLAGTISYKFGGTGCCSNGTGTSTTGSLTATALSVPIAQASALDLSNLPTTIYVDSEVMLVTATTATSGGATLTIGYNGRGLYNSGASFSTIAATHSNGANVGQFRVTGSSTKFISDGVQATCPAAASASLPSPTGIPIYSTGTVTMTAGGAPIAATFSNGSPSISATNTFSANQQVIFTTTGTLPDNFFTQTVYFVISTGLSGSAFQVSLTLGGSAVVAGLHASGTQSVVIPAVMTGSGTTWNNANGIFTGNSQVIFVKATNSSTPFSYISFIPVFGLNSTTSIVMGTPYAGDSGPFAYYILNAIFPVLEYTRQQPADGSTGRTYQNGIQVCLGDTQMGGIPGHDYGSTTNNFGQTAQHYSYQTYVGPSGSSVFQTAFYGTSIAAASFYLRSGYKKAHDLWTWIESYLSPSPGFDSGYTGIFWFTQNAAPLGGYLNLAVDPNTTLAPSSLRGYGIAGASLATEGCTDDPRDDGVKRSALALGALFDGSFNSVPTYGTYLAALQAVYTGHDVGGTLPTGACKMPDNSFSNTTTVGNPVVSGLTMANNSTTVTGTGITSGMCSTVASGTLSVTANSVAISSVSGTGFSGASACTTNCDLKLILQQGAYTTAISFVYVNASTLTLNGQWPGTSGTISYTIDSAIPTQFAASTAVNDPNLKFTYSCTYVSPTQMTIFPAWAGSNGSSYNEYNNALTSQGSFTGIGGYAVEPFMLGGFTSLSLTYATAADVTHPWGPLANNVSNFMWSSPSYDPYSLGIQYAVNCVGCDQKVPFNSGTGYVYGGSNDETQVDASPFGIQLGRGLAVEPINSLSVAFKAGNINQSFGDHVYGAMWSNTTYAPNSGGFYTPGDNLSASNCVPVNTSLGYWKWPGFCFGIGMSHQWPAVRLGGVLPAVPVTETFSCKAVYSTTASCKVIATEPNGATVTATCAVTATCSVSLDGRQGNHLYVMQWISAGAVVLGQTQPTPIKPI